MLSSKICVLAGRIGRHHLEGIRRMETLVSTAWLAERLNNSNFRVVQASWNNCADYEKAHIPNAVCFDGEYCRDQKSAYKNMLPKPEEFAQYVGQKLGIDNNTDVIVYDANEASPLLVHAVRVWYMFRVFGHDKVSLLNGGLYRWINENRPVTKEPPKVSPKNFTSQFRRNLVLSYEDVVEKVVEKAELQLVDARPANSYKGVSTDTGTGHIPNALNVPVQSLMDPQTKLIRDKKQLEDIFKNAGVNFDRPIATSCGTGMTATGAALAAFLLGKKEVPVYDGSWYEWSRRAPDEYIVTG